MKGVHSCDHFLWMPNQVLVAGPDHLRHPKNRKVKCYVRLRALQDETGLTDEALQHIALICGPRCAQP